MVFRADGTIRTSAGWTVHRQATTGRSRPSRPNPEVLAAIRTTAARHADHPGLSRLGLGYADWARLFQAMIEAESGYRIDAESPKGAYGLGQLMPETAQGLGVDRTVPAENLDGAARYLLAQLERFGRVDLALAAYNAGPHRIEEYGGIPPFAETRSYLARVKAIEARLGSPAPEQVLSTKSSLVLKPGTDLR